LATDLQAKETIGDPLNRFKDFYTVISLLNRETCNLFKFLCFDCAWRQLVFFFGILELFMETHFEYLSGLKTLFCYILDC
jgi:hypothetical protein